MNGWLLSNAPEVALDARNSGAKDALEKAMAHPT
jgi:hypothetical protein